MFKLYYHIMRADCRRVQLALGEAGAPYQGKSINFWENDDALKLYNPLGSIPILLTDDQVPISGAQTICEYIDERYNLDLMGKTLLERAESRRLCEWFDVVFNEEVLHFIVGQKVYHRLAKKEEPDPSKVRQGGRQLKMHLAYMEWLLQRGDFLVGPRMTSADLAAAANISILDYLGEIPWQAHTQIKEWYTKIKHRPSFKPILQERLHGMPPAEHYPKVDF